MRRSDPIFNFKHGDHTCVFYWDLDGLSEILTPYIFEGLRRNEKCFCAQKPETLKALCDDLRFLGVNVEKEQKRGALDLHTTNEVYFHNMKFEPTALMELLEHSIEAAVQSGFSCFRTAGELSWAVEGRDECDRLVEYEQMVQASYPGKPAVGMCMYPIRSFEKPVLDQVVAAHNKVVRSGQQGSSTASLHIRWPERKAEIVTNKSVPSPYHYVVESHAGDILSWGKSPDFEGALESAEGSASKPR
jgi:hypothetical protein